MKTRHVRSGRPDLVRLCEASDLPRYGMTPLFLNVLSEASSDSKRRHLIAERVAILTGKEAPPPLTMAGLVAAANGTASPRSSSDYDSVQEVRESGRRRRGRALTTDDFVFGT